MVFIPGAYMKWYRSERNKKLAGICGGLSEMFSIDVTLIRFVFLMLWLTPVPIILAYIVAWLIVPKKGDIDAHTPTVRNPTSSRNARNKEFLTERR